MYMFNGVLCHFAHVTGLRAHLLQIWIYSRKDNRNTNTDIAVRNYFSSHFVKYSRYRKAFKITVAGLDENCTICHMLNLIWFVSKFINFYLRFTQSSDKSNNWIHTAIIGGGDQQTPHFVEIRSAISETKPMGGQNVTPIHLVSVNFAQWTQYNSTYRNRI